MCSMYCRQESLLLVNQFSSIASVGRTDNSGGDHSLGSPRGLWGTKERRRLGHTTINRIPLTGHRRGSDPETITLSASLTLSYSLDCPQESWCFGTMCSSSYSFYLTCYSCSKFWLRVRQLDNQPGVLFPL
jgi:hypothetical protein